MRLGSGKIFEDLEKIETHKGLIRTEVHKLSLVQGPVQFQEIKTPFDMLDFALEEGVIMYQGYRRELLKFITENSENGEIPISTELQDQLRWDVEHHRLDFIASFFFLARIIKETSYFGEVQNRAFSMQAVYVPSSLGQVEFRDQMGQFHLNGNLTISSPPILSVPVNPDIHIAEKMALSIFDMFLNKVKTSHEISQ